ncbi:MAG: DUF5691 domain-containing protein [Cyanobacteria bacterium J06635_15]
MDWKTLTTMALVGTDRQTPQPPSADDALDQVLAKLDWQVAESALLGAAATLALYQQVGAMPPTDEAPFDPGCDLEEAPLCKSVTARQLNQILSNPTELGSVLPEILGLMADAGQRLPEVVLPKLLQISVTHRDYRNAIASILHTSVLGKRGQWLAAKNPDWRYAAVNPADLSASIEEVWETDDRGLRCDRFQQWRNQDPNAARDFLAAHWQAELSRDRERLLTTLQTHLSDDDEPFLETVLTDRSKGVRQVAADLLAQLPQSRLGQRMAERAQACITLQGTPTHLVLGVNLPAELDPAWQRDGIARKPPAKGGTRAYWLEALISRTPLSVWTIQSPISALVAVANQTEWQAPLLNGWAAAAWRQKQADWLIALIRQSYLDSHFPLERPPLLPHLPATERETLLVDHRPTQRPCPEQAWKNWLLELHHCPGPWGKALGQAVLDHLQHPVKFTHTYAYRYAVQQYLRPIAIALPPEFTETIRDRLQFINEGTQPPEWADAFEKIQTVLAFRQAIHQGFQQG